MSRAEKIQGRAIGLVLCLCFQMGTAVANNYNTDVSLKTVMQALAKKTYTKVRFIERKSSTMLTDVIQLEGVLDFKPPAYLLKIVLKPHFETFELKQGVIYYARGNDGRQQLELEQYPVLKSFVTAYTSLLSGRLDRLERDYRVSFTSKKYIWRVQLFPRAAATQDYISEIRFDGEGDNVVSIVLLEPGGDTSTTRILPGKIVQSK
ncbi:MAG TPA: hypothetical protein ENI65_12030 [Gammaproteobacteria bacterium]|nr:hypothetical protein [Gammaproteobacteria bacterium]